MARERYSATANFVTRGWGQVEPNHMSAQRNGQIYAQLPAAADIEVLENGQYVKYDYANGVCDFSGAGEWMLVYNEVKVYRDGQSDADFAMVRDNYSARVYSPIDGSAAMQQMTSPRYYGGVDADGNPIRNVATPADPYEVDATANPFAAQYDYSGPKMMTSTSGTLAMVPRVFKTNVGDIYTTNCLIASTTGDPAVAVAPEIGSTFTPGDMGYLAATTATTGMLWQVVKVYDLGDRQPAVKLMRIQ